MVGGGWARHLRCPVCRSEFLEGDGERVCLGCGSAWGFTAAGVPDFRLRESVKRNLEIRIGENWNHGDTSYGFLPAVEADPAWGCLPAHLSPSLRAQFLGAGPGDLLLDLGCGEGGYMDVARRAGYEPVGLDAEGTGAHVLGDAQALPFAAETFRMVLSLAVLEHIRHPLLWAEEAWRVLRPGGRLVGTVAFQEPYHARSCFHMSHLGVLNTLQHAGFLVKAVSPSPTWTVWEAHARGGAFPGSPVWLTNACLLPLRFLRWACLHRVLRYNPERKPTSLHLPHTGSFAFVADKPAAGA